MSERQGDFNNQELSQSGKLRGGKTLHADWVGGSTCLVAQSCPALCNPMDCSQVSLFMIFSRQEYWSGLPFPTPGDLPEPGIEPTFLPSPALAGGLFTTSTTGLEGKVQRLESSHRSQGGTKNKAVGRRRFKRSYAVYDERIPSQMFLWEAPWRFRCIFNCFEY